MSDGCTTATAGYDLQHITLRLILLTLLATLRAAIAALRT